MAPSFFFFLALNSLNLKIVAFYLKSKTSVRNWTEFSTCLSHALYLRVNLSFAIPFFSLLVLASVFFFFQKLISRDFFFLKQNTILSCNTQNTDDQRRRTLMANSGENLQLAIYRRLRRDRKRSTAKEHASSFRAHLLLSSDMGSRRATWLS